MKPKIDWLWSPWPWIVAGYILARGVFAEIMRISPETSIDAGLSCVLIGMGLKFGAFLWERRRARREAKRMAKADKPELI